jgi:hypothetical protein
MAITEEDGDEALAILGGGVFRGVGDEEIGMLVVVDVGDGDPARAGSCGKGDGAEAGGGGLREEGGGESKNSSEGSGSHGATPGDYSGMRNSIREPGRFGEGRLLLKNLVEEAAEGVGDGDGWRGTEVVKLFGVGGGLEELMGAGGIAVADDEEDGGMAVGEIGGRVEKLIL